MKIKNWLLIALCVVMIVGLVACGQSNNEPTSPATMPSESTAPTEEFTAPPTTIPVHEHVYAETVTDATCTEEGKLVKTCECGEVVEEIIPVAPHDYETTTIAATYVDKGYDEHVCKVCQHSYRDNETDMVPHDHKYKDKVTKPTCTDKGYTTHTCELCGHTYKDTQVKALGHNYKTQTIAPTYTEKGYDVHKCSTCGNAYNDNYTDKIPHDCDYTAKETSSTCTEKGYTTYTCKLCGKTYKDNYKELAPHNFNVKTIQPTCTSKGYDEHTCKTCGKTEKKNETDMVAHTYTKKTVKPTCQSNGYDEFTCSVCKKTYKDNYTDKTDHDYKTTTVAPTCTKKGYDTQTCKTCDKSVKSNEKPALGHDYVVETVKPTAKEKGYDLHTCSRCKDSYKDNYTDPVITYTEVNETVYATQEVNIRKGPSTDFDKLGSLKKGDSITRVGIGDNGWSKVEYNGTIAYMFSDYLSTTKPPVVDSSGYPMTYSDGSCKITIYREWYKNAYVYAAHITFSNYKRLGTECANGAYNNGYETTSHAAKRIGAIFAVNGCYSSPKLDYTVVRSGKIWNGSGRASFWCPAVYSFHNGKLLSAWDSGGTPGISGGQIDQLVADGKVTDTFCFGPPSLVGGQVLGKNEGARAQRTFIGTNGSAGDIWICVSDGRYNDGESAGLTFYEAAEYLQTKGCTFGVHLDGGGSSTMYFNGKVLNAAKNGQRSVVDFLYFK